MRQLRVTFPDQFPLNDVSIRYVQGKTGLYLIFLKTLSIPYPFLVSRLIYIGMSESKQNSIGNRLRDHKSGQSGNKGIMNYAAKFDVFFTYLSTEMLTALGTDKAIELESLFLESFARVYGTYPICNNQSGITLPTTFLPSDDISIDWAFFKP